MFFLLILGLFFEKCCINWLNNRWGCNYNKIQKFIELEQRVRSINEKWQICPPPYNPKRYKEHYFKKNFRSIQDRFFESPEKSLEIMNSQKDEEKEFREFIPYKQAVILKHLIEFTIQLDGRCKDLNISLETSKMLDCRDEEIKHQIKIDEQKIVIDKLKKSA